MVVCQHGLEDDPQDVVTNDKGGPPPRLHAARLADRGFITVARRRTWHFTDWFGPFSAKNNAIKKTLFSTIVPQHHQQIVDQLRRSRLWIQSGSADADSSYGGSRRMRIPLLIEGLTCAIDLFTRISAGGSARTRRRRAPWAGTAAKRGGEYEIF